MKLERGVAQVSGTLDRVVGAATRVAGALGIAFSVGKMIQFGQQILADADALVKMSDKTGISLGGLQRLRVAAEDSGNTIDQLTGSINMFQKRLVGDSDAVSPALRRLHLDFESIKRLAPDQQFMAIGTALRTVTDPAERVALAVALFGRSGAEVLPTLVRGFDDLAAAGGGLDDQTVRALDAIGDALTRVWRKWKDVAAITMVSVVSIPSQIASLFNGVAQAEATANLARRADQMTPLEMAEFHRPTVNRPLPGSGIPAIGLSAVDQGVAEKDIMRQIELGAAARKAAEARRKLAVDVGAIERGSGLAGDMPSIGRTVDVQALATTAAAIRDVEQTARIAAFGYKGMADELTTLGEVVAINQQGWGKWNEEIGFVGPTIDMVEGKIESLGATIGDGLMKDLTNVPGMVASAFTGGGGIMGAVKGIGTMVGSTIGKAVGTSVAFLGKLGGPIGAAIGSLAGPLIQGLVGLFGISPAVKQARADLDKFRESLYATLTATQLQETGNIPWKNDLVAIRDLFILTGRAGAEAVTLALWDTDNPKRMAGAMREIEEALAAAKQRATEFNAALGGVASAVEVVHGVLPPLLRESILALAEMEGLTQAERLALLSLANDTKPQWEELIGIAESYGITLAGLGPKFQQGALDEAATRLYDDFQLLTGAGADVGSVLLGMSEKINQLVLDAVRFGGTVPEQFRPLLQNLIEAGLLTDAQGRKISDLSGITFSDTPLDTGITRLAATIDHLADVLGRLPGMAVAVANSIPPNPFAGWGPPEFSSGLAGALGYASAGGLVTEHGIQYLAGGGSVLPFRPRGTDTVPAMLTPGERVLSREETAAYDAGARRVGAVADFAAMQSEIQGLRMDLRRQAKRQAEAQFLAMRDALVQAGRRR